MQIECLAQFFYLRNSDESVPDPLVSLPDRSPTVLTLVDVVSLIDEMKPLLKPAFKHCAVKDFDATDEKYLWDEDQLGTAYLDKFSKDLEAIMPKLRDVSSLDTEDVARVSDLWTEMHHYYESAARVWLFFRTQVRSTISEVCEEVFDPHESESITHISTLLARSSKLKDKTFAKQLKDLHDRLRQLLPDLQEVYSGILNFSTTFPRNVAEFRDAKSLLDRVKSVLRLPEFQFTSDSEDPAWKHELARIKDGLKGGGTSGRQLICLT